MRYVVMVVVLGVCAGLAVAGEVKVERDVMYKEGAGVSEYEGERCRLDLYVPAGEGKGRAVLVWFHGGALAAGDKSGGAKLARRLAGEEGVVVACANYRLSPRVTYPAYVEDAAAAVRWVKEHSKEWGGDARRVFVAGHSAGGYLAAMVGWERGFAEKAGFGEGELAGVVAVAPQVFTHYTVRKERGIENPEWTPVIDAAAPAYHVRKGGPATLILLGDDDWPVRREECAYFVGMLKHLGHADVGMHVIEGRNHVTIAGKLEEE